MEKHQKILELLLKEESDFPNYKRVYCEYDIQELLFPDLDKDSCRIIMDEVCLAQYKENDAIKYDDQDFGRNPQRFISKNTYTKAFYDAGGFIQLQKNIESKNIEESILKEQEKRIKNLTEINLEVNNKLVKYQHKYRHIDTANKFLNFIISSGTLIKIILLLSVFGVIELIRLGWILIESI